MSLLWFSIAFLLTSIIVITAKVREATSNDPWGPSGTQMNELAQLTYNQLVIYLFIRINNQLIMTALEMISSKSWKC